MGLPLDGWTASSRSLLYLLANPLDLRTTFFLSFIISRYGHGPSQATRATSRDLILFLDVKCEWGLELGPRRAGG